MSYPREKDVALEFAKRVGKEDVIRFGALECRLHGALGGVKFGPWHAVSGAGMNSYTEMKGVKLSEWMPTRKSTGKGKGQRGGVIPPGWWIALPEVLSAGATSCYVGKGAAPTNAAVKLVPFRLDNPEPGIFGECGRGGFYIHGASKHPSRVGSGSDGCILLGPLERKWLASKVRERGGAWLQVVLNTTKINELIEAQLALAHFA